jgi:hypothetical protein
LHQHLVALPSDCVACLSDCVACINTWSLFPVTESLASATESLASTLGRLTQRLDRSSQRLESLASHMLCLCEVLHRAAYYTEQWKLCQIECQSRDSANLSVQRFRRSVGDHVGNIQTPRHAFVGNLFPPRALEQWRRRVLQTSRAGSVQRGISTNNQTMRQHNISRATLSLASAT